MALQFGVTKKLINRVYSKKNNSFTAMKMRITLFCFYFLLLMAIPTIKVVKSHLGCASICCKEQKSEIPKGCQKGKCILNFNFNTGQFIGQQEQNVTLNNESETIEKNQLNYEKNFIPNYTNIIWHPPKNSSVI
jgi:hypothetical protein